jgi:hypothetical protein
MTPFEVLNANTRLGSGMKNVCIGHILLTDPIREMMHTGRGIKLLALP